MAIQETLFKQIDQRKQDLDKAAALRSLVERLDARGDLTDEEAAWKDWACAIARQLDERAITGLTLNVEPTSASWR